MQYLGPEENCQLSPAQPKLGKPLHDFGAADQKLTGLSLVKAGGLGPPSDRKASTHALKSTHATSAGSTPWTSLPFPPSVPVAYLSLAEKDADSYMIAARWPRLKSRLMEQPVQQTEGQLAAPLQWLDMWTKTPQGLITPSFE